MFKRVKFNTLPIAVLTVLLFICLSAAVGIYATGNVRVAQAAEITAPKTLEELREADPYEVAKLSYFDGRQYGYLTPVRNQGSTGTCVVHATIAAVEASILREGIDPDLTPEELDLSEFNLSWQVWNRDGSVDPLGNTPGFEYSGDWTNSTAVDSNIATLLQWTAPRQTYGEDDFRFTKEGEVKYILEESFSFNINQTEEIKAAVAKYGSVTIGYCAGELFDNIYYSSKGITTGGHESVIVGWDDNIPASYFQGGKTPTINGGWLIRNSWGTGYHDNGYFWLSYDAYFYHGICAFDMGLRSDYGNNYYYDGKYNGSVSLSGNPIKASAIYEAKGGNDEKCELVKGANVNVRGINVEITVDFYKNVTANKNDNCNVKVNLPESGIHVATVTRTVHGEGFYYIELDEKDWFSVDKGTYFSTVVTLTPQGISCGIGYCYETGSNKAYDMTYYFNPQTGQWINSAEYMIGDYGCVFRIKCYTVFADYKDISESEISLEKDSYTYTGSAFEPIVTVTYENKVLTSADYTVSYVNNINAGEASVIVTGIGDYAGSKIKSFIIDKAESPGFSFNDLPVEYENGAIRAPANAKLLSDILLPEGWEWQNSDSDLVNDMEATAVYVGVDKENYENLTQTLHITVERVADGDTDTDDDTDNSTDSSDTDNNTGNDNSAESGIDNNGDIDKSENNDFNWAWLALPAGIIIIGAVVAVVIIKGKKKNG